MLYRRLILFPTVLFFAFIVIPAGHGAVPLLYLMLAATFTGSWMMPVWLAWASMGLSLGSDFIQGPLLAKGIGFVGICGMLLSWYLFLGNADEKVFMMVYSIPYLACACARLLLVLWHPHRPRAQSPPSHPGE